MIYTFKLSVGRNQAMLEATGWGRCTMRIKIIVNGHNICFAFFKLPDIWFVEQLDHLVIQLPSSQLYGSVTIKAQVVKMIKNGFKKFACSLFRTKKPPILFDYVILLYIPCRKSPAKMPKHMDFWKTNRPVIQVFLISEFTIFVSCITPFNTPIPPPPKGRQPVFVISKGYKLNTIFASQHGFFILRRIPMLGNQYRIVLHFIQ